MSAAVTFRHRRAGRKDSIGWIGANIRDRAKSQTLAVVGRNHIARTCLFCVGILSRLLILLFLPEVQWIELALSTLALASTVVQHNTSILSGPGPRPQRPVPPRLRGSTGQRYSVFWCFLHRRIVSHHGTLHAMKWTKNVTKNKVFQSSIHKHNIIMDF